MDLKYVAGWRVCSLALMVVSACGGGSAQPVIDAPVSNPPSTPAPRSVKEPPADTEDRHGAALARLLSAPWGMRSDRAEQVRIPLPDPAHWKRVRYFSVEHYVGFRYGDDHHAMAIGFVQDLPRGTAMKSDTCLRRFEAWGLPQTHAFDVKFSPFESHLSRWQSQSLESRSVDGKVNLGFSTTEFSSVWAAYPAYRDACFVLAIAIPWQDHADLARKLRDRFVSEGFSLLTVASEARPERK